MIIRALIMSSMGAILWAMLLVWAIRFALGV